MSLVTVSGAWNWPYGWELGGTSSPRSALELPILTCNISICINKSGSDGSMVTLGRCCLLYLTGMYDTGHGVAFKSGLLLGLDGSPHRNQCLCNV